MDNQTWARRLAYQAEYDRQLELLGPHSSMPEFDDVYVVGFHTVGDYWTIYISIAFPGSLFYVVSYGPITNTATVISYEQVGQSVYERPLVKENQV